MAKRKTNAAERKTRREAEQKARLKQRLADLAAGAYGGYEPPTLDGDDFMGMPAALGLEAFGRWLGAIRHTFLKGDRTDYRITDIALEHYDSLDEATEWLWAEGVRPEAKGEVR